MRITVVRALPARQSVVELTLEPGTTAGEAVAASGLGVPDAPLGIAGRQVQPGRLLDEGDRVEVLRSLDEDPNDARRRRAKRRRTR